MPTIDEVYDYVKNQHPYKLTDLNGTNGYTNFTIEIPYDTVADIQQGHLFFVECNTLIDATAAATIKTLDGTVLSKSVLGDAAPGRFYAFSFDTSNNIVLVPFHDQTLADRVDEMYTGFQHRITSGFTEEAGGTLRLNDSYNSTLELQKLISEILIEAANIEVSTKLTAEVIEIPAYNVNNPSFIYGGDNSRLITENILDDILAAKISDALEAKIKIDSRTPEAYEIDTGEELADETIYLQVSQS